MENQIWIDLGLIGHKSKVLKELYSDIYLTELPTIDEHNVIVFIDYTVGGKQGVKVLTNCFSNENSFHRDLSQKLISKYVAIN
jgi:hypothetical protein